MTCRTGWRHSCRRKCAWRRGVQYFDINDDLDAQGEENLSGQHGIEKLLEMLQHPENFIVSVDSMWRSDTPQKVSFFINLLMKTKMMDRKKSVILFAEYKEITSLKESAAFQVSKFVRNLPELFLPVTLQTEISKFL